jgi:hypothetical protein
MHTCPTPGTSILILLLNRYENLEVNIWRANLIFRVPKKPFDTSLCKNCVFTSHGVPTDLKEDVSVSHGSNKRYEEIHQRNGE